MTETEKYIKSEQKRLGRFYERLEININTTIAKVEKINEIYNVIVPANLYNFFRTDYNFIHFDKYQKKLDFLIKNNVMKVHRWYLRNSKPASLIFTKEMPHLKTFQEYNEEMKKHLAKINEDFKKGMEMFNNF